MLHPIEMWLDRDGERRLVHIELDVDMSMFPQRLIARGFRAWLSDDWAEMELTEQEIIKAISLARANLEFQQEQIGLIEQYQDHVQKC